MSREEQVLGLKRNRPRSLFNKVSCIVFAFLCFFSWISLEGSFFSEKRITNFKRFLGEVIPYPLQNEDFSLSLLLDWSFSILNNRGFDAALNTLSISIIAIVIAGLFSVIFSFLASQKNSARYIFIPTRVFLIFLRSIPEYLWAFIILMIFGPSLWTAIIALAVHNIGVLSKLTADIIDNLDSKPLRALKGLGASQKKIALTGVLPMTFPRFILFFFVRWETCLRESTVLGLLGIVSLGYFIQDARARNFYDEMFFYIILSSVLVIIGDVISSWLRGKVR